jgi:hypothetical protein
MTLGGQMQHNIGLALAQLGLQGFAIQNIGGRGMCLPGAAGQMLDHPGGDKTSATGQKYTFWGHCLYLQGEGG